MKRYPAYKDSGVDWLGEVPEGWEAPHLKRFASLVYGDALASDVREIDGDIPVYGSNGPVGTHNVANTLNPAILIGRKGSYGALNWTDAPCFAIDTVYFIDSRSANCNLRWLYWALHTANLDAISQDTGVPGLSRADAHGTPIPLPPLPEQQSIARFLDREVGKIDALVQEQRRLIALLAEKRQAVISHAVTRGLNPATPLKPSGIDWLGDIPEGWEVVAVKNMIEHATSGPRGWSEFIGGEAAIFFQSQNIGRDMSIDVSEASRLDPPEDMDAARSMLRNDDVVVCITGARTGAVGHIQHLQETAFVNQHVCLLRPCKALIDGRFLSYCLFSTNGQEQLLAGMYGLKQGLGLEQVRSQMLGVPQIEIQREIVAFLDAQTAQLDALTTAATSAIALLQERRAALISAAVTGKIDLRDISSQSLSEPEPACHGHP